MRDCTILSLQKKKGNKEQLLIPVPDFNTPQDKIMPSTEMLLNINKND